MEENTSGQAASSPPAFMQAAAENIEKKRTTAERAKSREEEAQITDEMNILLAHITKATLRLKEQADYLNRIEVVIAKNLPYLIAELPLGQVLDTEIALEAQVDAVEEQVKAIKAHITSAREINLPERLDAEETKTVNAASGARMSRTTRVLASIKPGMKDGAYAWLRKPVFFEDYTPEEEKTVEALRKRIEAGEDVHFSEFPPRRPKHPWQYNDEHELVLVQGWNDEPPSYGSLIQETVNSSSLSAIAKELLEGGDKLPGDWFNIHAKDGVSITKPKGGKK